MHARCVTLPLLMFAVMFAANGAAQPAIQWTTNTVVVDSNTAQSSLTAVSRDGHVLVFNTSDARITGLSAGQILFLQDLGARRVLGTVRQGPVTAVATNAAALTDLIQDGTIQFPTNSHDPSILDSQDTDFGPGVDRLNGNVDNWQYEAKGSAGDGDPNNLSYSFKATKHVGTLDATVEGKGLLKNAGFSFMADIHGAKLQKLYFTAPVEGNLNVNWDAKTSGAENGIGERRLRLPTFFKEIFVANHLPFLYEISANILFIPGLGGRKDNVAGGFTVNYDGKGGFVMNSKGSSPIQEMKASTQSVEKVTSSALAPHGIVLAINAPKIAFSFGTGSFMEAVHSTVPTAIKNSKVADGFEPQLAKYLSKDIADFFRTEGGAYVQWVNEYDYTGSGPMSIVPNCTTTHFNLIASGGFDAKMLGVDGKGSVELFKTQSTKTEPDIAGCRVGSK
ncbi:hypothetical protein [Occallatibacter savannae]|uniref:hypothetical protein n=1 Tax=Occallatibacter savannae TaxID=1002691 RepID=UPI000D69FC87|nr:hypothetical protein [Occallatibacter savannae]